MHEIRIDFLEDARSQRKTGEEYALSYLADFYNDYNPNKGYKQSVDYNHIKGMKNALAYALQVAHNRWMYKHNRLYRIQAKELGRIFEPILKDIREYLDGNTKKPYP